jgi:hypothetical protein
MLNDKLVQFVDIDLHEMKVWHNSLLMLNQ